MYRTWRLPSLQMMQPIRLMWTLILTTSNAALSSRINEAFRKIDENSEGIAVAMAMGGLTLPVTKPLRWEHPQGGNATTFPPLRTWWFYMKQRL